MTDETIKAVAEAIRDVVDRPDNWGCTEYGMLSKAALRAFLASPVMRDVREALEELDRADASMQAFLAVQTSANNALAKLAELGKELGE